MSAKSPIAILGAGGWGTALAAHLGRTGHSVRLWGRDRAVLDEISSRRLNSTYLPGVTLPPQVTATPELPMTLAEANHVVLAIPSHGLQPVLAGAAKHLRPGAVVVSAT